MAKRASPETHPIDNYTLEMRMEMDRLAVLVTTEVDFSRPPDQATRDLDERNNAVWNIDLPEMASIRHFEIPATIAGAAPCEALLYEPPNAGRGIIVYVHGGGWSLMNLATHDRLMRALSLEAGMPVVGIHYRLAPENPFPAGLKDVVSALRAVLSHRSELRLPAGPLVIAGDSAGANLAMAAMLHEIDAGQALPVGALLFYGVFGADFDTPSYQVYAEGHRLTTAIMRQFWDWYLPEDAKRGDPLAAPLEASDAQLRALPPLFLAAAQLDPLASDTYDLKRRLDGLGRDDELLVEPGVIHGFMQMTAVLDAARRAVRKAAQSAGRFVADA